MKNVRVWFKKFDECKYISHLDLNRCMLRAMRRANLPIWYTEGFNPHPFATFPLPISLGLSATRECMDIRIVDEEFDIGTIAELMNPFLPLGIRVFDATYPEYDPKFICFASYDAKLSCDNLTGEELKNRIIALHSRENVLIQKKCKKGFKDIDVLPYIKDMQFYDFDDNSCSFTVTLPAGNVKNVALTLIIKAIESVLETELNFDITKLNMFTEDMTEFR